METGTAGDLFVAAGNFCRRKFTGQRIITVAVRSAYLAGSAGSRLELVRRIVPFIA